MTLKAIKTERDEYAESCRACVERTLEKAQSDPFESIIIVAVTRSGNVIRDYSTIDRVGLAGHLTIALHEALSFDR